MFSSIARVFLFAVVVVAVFVGWSFFQDRRASAFVAESTQQIFEHWDYYEFKRRSTAAMREGQSDALRGEANFNALRNVMGAFKHADKPLGTAGFEFKFGKNSPGRGVSGNYTVHVQFERGEALLIYVVVRDHGAWRIDDFKAQASWRAMPATRT